jgi:hypothetical protein
MRFYDIKNPVVIIYEPRCSCVVGKLNELLVHYEIADDRLGFTKVPRWIKTNIDFLIEKADLVTVASQYLYDKLIEKRRHNIFLVGNGVEVEHFKKAREDIEIPKDICNVKKPILGYVGTIGEWFDFQLIEIVLNKFPNIAGKPVISTALPEVKKYDGTVYVAENYDEFLSYINKALTSTHDLEKFFKIANENTWEEKAKEMVKIIQTEKRGDD